jgi:hypothetical protein
MIQVNNYDGGADYTGLRLSHTEIDCGGRTIQSGPSTHVFVSPYGVQEGLLYGHWMGDHLNIHGCGNDALMRTDTHLSSSYLWGLAQNSACFTDPTRSNNSVCDHLDTIEVTTGTANLDGSSSDATGNYIVGNWNSCIWVQTNGGSLSNFTFAKNWCAANGTYFAYKSQQASGGVFTNVRFVNDRAVRYPQNTHGLNPEAAWIDLSSATPTCGLVYDDNSTLVAESGVANPRC